MSTKLSTRLKKERQQRKLHSRIYKLIDTLGAWRNFSENLCNCTHCQLFLPLRFMPHTILPQEAQQEHYERIHRQGMKRGFLQFIEKNIYFIFWVQARYPFIFADGWKVIRKKSDVSPS